MPTHKSCEKRLRQDEKRSIHNRDISNTIKTLKKQLRSEMPADEKEKLLSVFYSKVDRAVKTHIMHKKTANRSKSRITHLVKKELEATK
ncbi:MAG: 30S ribosomal protein S20 [Candidatus Cloacimonadota bacterium]|nr:30S ribosomal protein S20 [Candidatus Cloacimonadota bacterium]